MNIQLQRQTWLDIALSALLVFSQVPLQAGWQPDPAFGLGSAGDFAVLSLGKPSAETLGQSKLDLSAVEVYGDVGVGPFGVLDFQGPSTIHGNLYIDPTLLPQDILSDVGTVTGETIYTDSLAGPVAEAIAASEDLAALAPTQSFERLLTSTTIYGNGGLNVIAIDGIDYARSNPTSPLVLTLMGGDNDLFVLNVKGKFVLGPHARILSPAPSQVLINVLAGQVPVQFASDSLIEGTLLATSRKMGPLQGTSGPIIGALVSEISLVGGATVVLEPPPVVPLAVITAPSAVLVGLPVPLDGSGSSAPYGDPLSYQWSLLEKPLGSLTTIADPQSVSTYLTPDLPGDYLVQLVVDDGEQASEPALADILASEAGDSVDLSLAISDDPDPVVRKQTLRYTMTLSNQSQSTAHDVLLMGCFSGDVRGTPTVSPAAACSFNSATEFNCDFAELGGLQQVQVELTVIPKVAGSFSASGSVSSTDVDANPGDNSAAEVTTVLKR